MAGKNSTTTNNTRALAESAHIAMDASRRANLPFLLGGLVVCILILVFTLFAWRMTKSNMHQLAESRLLREVHSIQQQITDRLGTHTNVLYGARGLFIASDFTERDEWKAFVNGFAMERNYPGVVGMGYIEYVTASQKRSFEESVRSDHSISPVGFPDFQIHPEGDRDEYYVMKYIEPYEGNEKILGLDAGTFTSALLHRIRDSGELTSIGRMDFGYGSNDYVFLLPFYQKDLPKQTPQERREAFIGFVVAVIRPHIILEGVQSVSEDPNTRFVMEFLDERDNLVYRHSFPRETLLPYEEDALVQEMPLQVAGLQWTLRVTAPSDFGLDAAAIKAPQFVLLAGFAFVLLFFAIFYLVSSSRLRALRFAGRMTGELGKFQLAVKNASNHIIITDPEGVILYANASVQKITGYLTEEVIGNTPRLWGQQMDKEFYQKMWNLIKDQHHSYDGELINKRKDGTQYDALVHISPIIDKEGNLFGFVGIEEDITERKRLEQTRSEFVSLASHQLRTPLTAMRLTMETLLNGASGTLEEKQRQMILRSQEYAVHMSETIYTMLTISHLEAGKLTVNNSELDLKKLLSDLYREYEPEFERKKQNVSCDCQDGFMFQSDPRLLREVLGNLMSNSSKYTPEGGQITVSATRQDGQIRIDITDTGYGIPKEQHDRVFGKFFRGKNVIKKNTEGTGLGLYLVYSLTTLLGGRITFESEENHGTTFSLFLPITPSTHE